MKNFFHSAILTSALLVVSLVTVYSQTGTRGGAGENLQPQATGKIYAIVIGISNYQSDSLHLNYAARDAMAFSAFLKSKAGGSLDPNNVYLFIDSMAIKDDIVSQLYDLKAEILKPGDMLYFFFAGHGDIEKVMSEGNDALLLCYNSLPKNYLKKDNNIDMGKISGWLGLMSKSGVNVVFIADACHSGKVLSGGMDGRQRTLTSLAESWANETKILSCQANQTSEENQKWGGGRGVFSYVLENGMKGLADMNSDGSVSLLELNMYLMTEVTNQTGGSQIPNVKGDMQKIMAKVDAKTLADVKAEKERQLSGMVAMNTQRGSDETILEGADAFVKENYKNFKEAILQNHLLHPDNASAYFYFRNIMTKDSLFELKKLMKRNLVSKLEESSMIFIQQQLQGVHEVTDDNADATQKQVLQMTAGIENLDTAISLLGEAHFLTPSYRARKLYLEAYLLYNTMMKLKQNYNVANFDSCVNKLRKAVDLEHNASYAYYLLGDLYSLWTSKYRKEAIASYKKYLNLVPGDGLAYVSLAYIYKDDDQQKDADSAIVHALEAGAGIMAELYSAVAGYYQSYKDYETAKIYYRKALNVDSNYSKALLDMGVTARRQHNNDTAKYYYLRLLKAIPDYAYGYNNLANIFLEEKDRAKAEEYYRKAIALDTNYALAYSNLGSLLEKKKDYHGAKDVYMRSYLIDPYNSNATTGLGNIYYRFNDFDSAWMFHYYSYYSLDSSDEIHAYNLARTYYGRKEYTDAEEMYRRALAIDSNYELAWNGLGNIYYNSSNYTEAKKCYEHAVKLDSTDASFWYNLGNTYSQLDEDKKMVKYYLKAIEVDSEYSYALAELAKYYGNHKEDKKAEFYLKRALQSDTDDVGLLNSVGYYYYERQNYTEAEKYFRKGISKNPEHYNCLYNIAQIYYDQYKYEEAVPYFRRASLADVNKTGAAEKVGDCYYYLGNYEKAIDYYQTAIDRSKNFSTTFHNDIGLAYFYAKDGENAKKYFAMVLEHDSESTTALYYTGIVEYDSSNYAAARNYFNLALAVDSTYAFYYAYRALTFYGEKDFDNALRDFTTALYYDSTNYYINQQMGLLLRDNYKQPEKSIPYFVTAVNSDTANKYYSYDYLAYNYFLLKDSANSEKYFLLSTEKTPEGNSAPYNLACLYSLHHNEAKALQFLEMSIKRGYDDFEHMDADTDLDNIRNLPAYASIIKKYRK